MYIGNGAYNQIYSLVWETGELLAIETVQMADRNIIQSQFKRTIPVHSVVSHN